MSPRRLLPLIIVWVLVQGLPAALACTACYGKSDSALAKGMNNGIFVLLGFIGLVLVGVSLFFVFIIRRAARMQAQSRTFPTPTDF